MCGCGFWGGSEEDAAKAACPDLTVFHTASRAEACATTEALRSINIRLRKTCRPEPFAGTDLYSTIAIQQLHLTMAGKSCMVMLLIVQGEIVVTQFTARVVVRALD